MKKILYFYIDDSGKLSKQYNGDYFIYAGYVFESLEERNSAIRKYRSVVKMIQRDNNINKELKAVSLNNNNKNRLFKVMKNFSSFSVRVEIDKIHEKILSEKKSRQRFKDYALKRGIKTVVVELLKTKRLFNGQDIMLNFYIDEQSTGTNGFYNLKDSIYEELKSGMTNDYFTFIKPVLDKSELNVSIKFLDSSNEYLIQASDILANRIGASYAKKREDLRIIENHYSLHLP